MTRCARRGQLQIFDPEGRYRSAFRVDSIGADLWDIGIAAIGSNMRVASQSGKMKLGSGDRQGRARRTLVDGVASAHAMKTSNIPSGARLPNLYILIGTACLIKQSF